MWVNRWVAYWAADWVVQLEIQTVELLVDSSAGCLVYWRVGKSVDPMVAQSVHW